MQGWPGPLDGGNAPGGSCGDAKGINRTGTAPAATNWNGGAAHRRRLLREFPSIPRRRASALSSGSFGIARGILCGGCGGLKHGGAPEPR
jgi:hypothetical protein